MKLKLKIKQMKIDLKRNILNLLIGGKNMT